MRAYVTYVVSVGSDNIMLPYPAPGLNSGRCRSAYPCTIREGKRLSTAHRVKRVNRIHQELVFPSSPYRIPGFAAKKVAKARRALAVWSAG